MIDQTQPENVEETQPGPAKKPFRFGFWIGLLVLVVALGLGSAAGYGEGVRERVDAQSTMVSGQLGEQMKLAQQDIDAKRFDVAQQRLEYIIQQNPTFPGAAEKLAEVLVQQAITPTPLPTETPTITPTPDLRSQETIFAQAQQQLQGRDWNGLIQSLDSLRKADPTYKAALADGMYYTALRNRGVDQIMGAGVYKQTNLEGGIYDLTLAERFGPLDGYADGLRSFARMYITGASFWTVNWQQAVEYFRQVYQYTPNLRDSSNVTAGTRLHDALQEYGAQIATKGSRNERCKALDLWDEASKISPLGSSFQSQYTNLYNECFPPTDVPTEVLPTAESTQQVPPTAEPPTQEPPTPEPPTNTPAP